VMNAAANLFPAQFNLPTAAQVIASALIRADKMGLPDPNRNRVFAIGFFEAMEYGDIDDYDDVKAILKILTDTPYISGAPAR